MNAEQLDVARHLAAQLQVDSIRASTEAGAGHPTSSLSAADLMAVLLVGHLEYDWDEPRRASNDHLIFSKGPALPGSGTPAEPLDRPASRLVTSPPQPAVWSGYDSRQHDPRPHEDHQRRRA